MLADRPTPAVPPNAFANAARAGSADGALVLRWEGAAAGAAAATGEAAMAAVLVERAGLLVVRDEGMIVGTSDEAARVVCAAASCVVGDCEGASIARGESLVALACDVCRATADEDGAGEGLLDCTGDCVGVVAAAATLAAAGVAVVGVCRFSTGALVLAIVGDC